MNDAPLQGQSIVCLASGRWRSIWRNRQQIMSRLARRNKVLYVEPHTVAFNNAVKNLTNGGAKASDHPSIEVGLDNLWVYHHPDWGFTSRWPGVDHMGFRLRVNALRQALRQLSMADPIFWVVDPKTYPLLKYFKKKLVCYHVVDNYAAAPWRSKALQAELIAAEQEMLKLADVVIVTSPALLESKQQQHANVHLVKNAVDYHQFAAAKESGCIPSDMRAIPQPILGYVGAVNEKLDYDLLQAVATAAPQWSIVLVGPVTGDPDSPVQRFVQQRPANVYILGKKEVSEVAYYVNGCTVCLLPYVRNEYTANVDSLKLYEYLACAKPVVATRIPAVQEFAHVVYVADNPQAFIQNIELALTGDTPTQQAQRQNIAAQNTWDQRVMQISQVLSRCLEQAT